jgi:hypothetical protein
VVKVDDSWLRSLGIRPPGPPPPLLRRKIIYNLFESKALFKMLSNPANGRVDFEDVNVIKGQMCECVGRGRGGREIQTVT